MSKKLFYKEAIKFIDWSKNSLRHWANTSLDTNGGFAEQLSLDGAPDYHAIRKVRTQARQAYVFAHASDLDWCNDCKKLSDHAWNYLLLSRMQRNKSKELHNWFPKTIQPTGEALDVTQDTYTHAFILLAAAWRYKSFNDKTSIVIANKVIKFLNKHICLAYGGWNTEFLTTTYLKKQNPHMHLFEAFLALYSSTGEDKYVDYATKIYKLFQKYFFNTNTSLVTEHFDNTWKPIEGGGPYEPGHMMEWSSLLIKYQKITGSNVDYYVESLFNKSLEIGFNKKLGLLCDYVYINDVNMNQTFRTWPQTEYIKSLIAQIGMGNESIYKDAAKAIDSMFKYFLNVPINGTWNDKVDENGLLLSNFIPSSTQYHLLSAASEVNDLLKQQSNISRN